MNRRDFIKSLSAGITSVFLSGCKILLTHKRPNFLFILVDDLGWMDLGCYGSTFYETPNVDQLASKGMKFTNAYAACPVCSPTRASIMTGKYPARMNTTDWFGAPQPETVHKHWTKNKPLVPAHYIEYLDLDEFTIAEALQQVGYKTFFAGKWHLGPIQEYWPENQGFDINKGGWETGSPGYPGRYFPPYGNPRLEDGPEGEHLPDRLANETVKFIQETTNKPFLAFLSFYSVHTPLMTRKDLEQKYLEKKSSVKIDRPIFSKEGNRKVRQVQEHEIYAGMVEAMDQAVGKVLKSIEECGLDENTIVFFMSDNGGLSTAEGWPTSNLPLRAGKGWLYEGGIREPMIVKWPGQVKPGSTCSEPVISNDFYPTILQMTGLALRPKQHLDGVSLLPLLKDKRMKRGELFWHYPHYGNQGGNPGAAVRDGDFKLIEFFEDGHKELYNLKEDISEKNNLIDKMPEKAAELSEKLHTWQKEVNARMPSPNPVHSIKNERGRLLKCKFILLVSGVFCLVLFLCCCSKGKNQKPSSFDSPNLKLVWSDEFVNDGHPDSSNWTYETGFVRNEEAQYYQSENAYCENGFLIIEARKEQVRNPIFDPMSDNWRINRGIAEYTSASLTTRGLHSWKFGRFEMRAKVETEAGLWPAFWTLGIKGRWPHNGEIDIMEYYDNTILANVAWGAEKRWQPVWDDYKLPLDSLTLNDPNWSDKFHVWIMDWNKMNINLYLDDRLMNSVNLSETVNKDSSKVNPFLQPHYIIVNLAIGGTRGGDPSKTKFPSYYKIDYIRIYQANQY